MLLITSGCSFSEYRTLTKTWPKHLAEKIGYKHQPLGLSSQGNGLIMRKLIHYIESNDIIPEETLVAIMWSGPSRQDFFNSCVKNISKNINNDVLENPTYLDKTHEGGWVIMNHHWEDLYSKTYYNYFSDPVYYQLLTLEYILHTQWYLERKNIPYIMMCYTNEVFSHDCTNHPELFHLYNQIDFTKFVDIKGCYEWCLTKTNILFVNNDNHPTEDHYEVFTDEVIIPYLKIRGLY